MAILDDKKDACVVRIVYDGPPFSGKTTTLRALSEQLCRPMETPEEHDGRTLYFDWLDYTAGRFEGRPIRCQIVSVPGQRSLFDRRKALLREADAVVFVADTGSIGMDLSLKYAQELGGILAGLDEPRPGVIIGANKRDVEDAIEVADVVDKFRNVGLDGAVIETTATTNTGVHESFLFGVRLALDRVRELSARGLLKTGSPVIDSCGDLLEQLTVADSDPSGRTSSSVANASAVVTSQEHPVESPPTSAVRQSGSINVKIEKSQQAAQEIRTANSTRPEVFQLPDPLVPTGFIWPPIEGRIVVQQAISTGSPVSRKTSTGSMLALSENGWMIHARKQDVFVDQEDARSALTEWARLHVRNKDYISARRCIVLSPEENNWRLWQVVKVDRSIDSFLTAGCRESGSRESVEHLLVACRKILQAAGAFGKATIRLSVNPARINVDSTVPKYTGFMPGFDVQSVPESDVEGDETSVVAACLDKHIDSLRTRFGPDLVLSELDAIQTSSPANDRFVNMLRAIVTAGEVTT